jgi:hypothetical protein
MLKGAVALACGNTTIMYLEDHAALSGLALQADPDVRWFAAPLAEL